MGYFSSVFINYYSKKKQFKGKKKKISSDLNEYLIKINQIKHSKDKSRWFLVERKKRNKLLY